MASRIKAAFEGIRAEDSLKARTMEALREKVKDRARPRRYFSVRRWAVAAACMAFMLFGGMLSHNIYFAEAAHIALDINPSVEITINRFDRVIGTEAYNADGEMLLARVDIQHAKVGVAMDELIAAAAQTGALQREGIVSVTVQPLLGDETEVLKNIESEVAASVAHHGRAQVDVAAVDGETRNAAYGLHMSPAKYLAILELQQVDPAATVEECENHTIGEIRRRTRAHGGGHHSQQGTTAPDGTSDDDTADDSVNDTVDDIVEGRPGNGAGNGLGNGTGSGAGNGAGNGTGNGAGNGADDAPGHHGGGQGADGTGNGTGNGNGGNATGNGTGNGYGGGHHAGR